MLKLEVRVPFNSTAEIRLPDSEGCTVLENGVEIAQCPGDAVLNRGSGLWQYEYRPNGKTITKKIESDLMPNF